MLKTLRLSDKFCRIRKCKNAIVPRRSFLSEAYRCDEAWSRRLESPLLRKINPSAMFIELEQKFANVGKISAVDVDIFVNNITEDTFLEEMIRTLNNLRLSTEATNILDSTHHAVIRYLYQNHIQELYDILNDRLNYGIFADHFCYNMLMDNFIKQKNYASAAKIASLAMLQEDADHPITNALSIYACHKYLENPDDWKKPEVQEDSSKEEVKIRVRYIRNIFFDDHFDLTDPRDLVGKTLNFQGKHRGDALGRTCQLQGLILYKKYDDVLKLIKDWLENVQGKIIYEDVFNLISRDNSGIQDHSEEFKLVENQLSILKERQNHKESLIEAIENVIKSAIKERAEKDMSEQCQRYLEWDRTRISILEKQTKEIEVQRRLANIERIKQDLKEREQLLTFFDNEEQIELQIEKLQLQEQKEDERIRKMHRSAKKLRELVAVESYIPPDVKSAK